MAKCIVLLPVSFQHKLFIFSNPIQRNNLNGYGDPKDGGTPLFDEITGKRIDRYEYILKNIQIDLGNADDSKLLLNFTQKKVASSRGK
ncbi:MAG: hypothetical protein AB1466_00715 [Actinomycetota bacterium]